MSQPDSQSKPRAGGHGTIQVTPAGLALFWISLGLLAVGAFRFDGALLLLGALGLAALGLARFWTPRNLQGLRVFRELPDHVFAGESFDITLLLNTGSERWLDAYAIEIHDDLLPKGPRGKLWVDRVPGKGGRATGKIGARLFRRGIERRRQISMRSTFPLGLFEVQCEVTLAGPEFTHGLIVFPRPLLPEELRRELDLAQFEIAHPHGLEPEPGGDFRGVRAWRPGDSLQSIHWPATARYGSMMTGPDSVSFSTLMVREWDPPGPRPQRFGILFHSLSPAGNLIRPDRFELALRIVAGLVLYCRDSGIPVQLDTPFHGLEGNRPTEPGVLRIPDRTGFNESLTRLAVAKRVPCRNPRDIAGKMSSFADCERIFVISDSPVNSWKKTVGGIDQTVVCIDSESVKIERPRLRLKLKASRPTS